MQQSSDQQQNILSLQYMNKDGDKKGNIALVQLDDKQQIQSIQNYQNLHTEQTKSFQIFNFKDNQYAISSSYDKQVNFIQLNQNNDKSNIILECPAVKKVHQILQVQNNEILMVDKHGDIYNLILEDNQVKFSYLTQNLATPYEFKSLFGEYIILGDAYSKLKVFDSQDILKIDNIMIPFKGLLFNVESFEEQKTAVLGFKFSEYNWQDIRRQRELQHHDKKNDEIEDEDQIQEDDNRVLKRHAGKQWFEFFKMQKENVLNPDFKAEKFFTLENVCKAKTLNLDSQKGHFVLATVKNDNSNQINVSIIDLNGNTVKEFNNQDFFNKIQFNKNTSKFQLIRINNSTFCLYINIKKSQINNKCFEKRELQQGCYKFSDEDLLYIFDI